MSPNNNITYRKVETTPKEKMNHIDLGVNINETVGFIASPDLITYLINLIALPLSKDKCEFGKIVLHFDDKRKEVWWSNKATEGSFLVNFGHASYDYFADCWGDGEIALPSSKILEYLEQIKEAKQVMFSANPKNADPEERIYVIQDGKRDIFHGFLNAILEVKTYKPRIDYARNQSENIIKLDDNYIPILKEESASLKYGGVVDASELKKIVERGMKLDFKTYPIDFTPNPAEMYVTFSDTTVTNKMRIDFKAGTMIVPATPISQVISEKIEAPAKVLRGEVTFRVAMKEKAPVYLLKVDKSDNPNGVMFAGMLLAAKEKIKP